MKITGSESKEGSTSYMDYNLWETIAQDMTNIKVDEGGDD